MKTINIASLIKIRLATRAAAEAAKAGNEARERAAESIRKAKEILAGR